VELEVRRDEFGGTRTSVPQDWVPPVVADHGPPGNSCSWNIDNSTHNVHRSESIHSTFSDNLTFDICIQTCSSVPSTMLRKQQQLRRDSRDDELVGSGGLMPWWDVPLVEMQQQKDAEEETQSFWSSVMGRSDDDTVVDGMDPTKPMLLLVAVAVDGGCGCGDPTQEAASPMLVEGNRGEA
jgi:hypothetical protein